MASLKEVKGRIATVSNTQKITSAMKMVASAKLHKAQAAIQHMLSYKESLYRILHHLLSANPSITSSFTINREVKQIAILVFSSNSSLCGAFNSNVIRRVTEILNEYKHLGRENIHLYPIGKKVADALIKSGYSIEGDYQGMAAKPTFHDAANMADHLMKMYLNGEIDKVEVVYHHYKNTTSQIIIRQPFLPIDLSHEVVADDEIKETDYILEPSSEELVEELMPKVLRLKLYSVLLDSNTSEHAARTMAMQIATDNAENLLQELKLMYNKTRQQAITSELLDIVGGQMA